MGGCHAAITEPSVEQMTLPSSQRPHRILCLHGHNSNNDITQLQILALKLSIGYDAECELLHGPHKGVGFRGLELFSDGPWYTWGLTEGEFDTSLEYVANHIKNNGPYDGVFAFSMGVTLVTKFTDPSVWRDRFGLIDCPWKFAILACGGGSRLMGSFGDNGKSSTRPLDVSSFHIKGMKDHHLPDSSRLEKYWNEDKRKTYTHVGGHELTMRIYDNDPDLKLLLFKFLDEQKKDA